MGTQIFSVEWRETRGYWDRNFEPTWFVAEGYTNHWQMQKKEDSEIRYDSISTPTPELIARANEEYARLHSESGEVGSEDPLHSPSSSEKVGRSRVGTIRRLPCLSRGPPRQNVGASARFASRLASRSMLSLLDDPERWRWLSCFAIALGS
jgi:hypothetical protein